MRIQIHTLLLLCVLPFMVSAQSPGTDTTAGGGKHVQPADVSDKSLDFVNKKYAGITDDVDKQSLKLAERMQRREDKLNRKLQKIDSTKAARLFAASAAKYEELEAKLQSPVAPSATMRINQYMPGIDSMATVMHFLSANNTLPAGKLAQIQAIGAQAQQLQGRLQEANELQSFVQQREQLLQSQLGGYSGMGGQLLGMNQQVYYYQQQLQQYKELINDPEKLGEAILTQAQQIPAFQSFWQRYSILAQLFPMPQNFGTPAALAGLQSRAQVQSSLSQSMPSTATNGADPSQFLQQQFQQAQSQLSTLKDKVTQLTGNTGGSGDMVVPEFTPNTQHNKSFLKRLTYGYNFQTSPPSGTLPEICAIGLSLGYKLSDKATIGTGASYQLGMGNGLTDISFTNQGVGLRSYAEWRIPDMKGKAWAWLGGLWLTGGFEYDYYQQFAKLGALANLNAWQRSALAGLTKKYKVGKRQGNIQVLYDFLAASEIPRGQQVVFRVGYDF